jgi:methionyl aminopeptidase
MDFDYSEIIKNTKKAGDIHKQIKIELDTFISSNIKLIDICKFIENKIKTLSSSDQINSGIAFPVGVSLNNIAAHWTPIKNNDQTILTDNDVLKIDYGVHHNGYIVDSAFTWSNNSKYDPLLNASREAVDTIIKNIGVDTTISEIGSWSEEIVKSYEIEKKGVLVPILPINNLCGHSIKQWTIHAGKFIQSIKNNNKTKIEEHDVLAIEIFTSTGSGTTVLDNKSSHYMLKENYNKNNIKNLKFNNSKKLLNLIERKFKTLPFTQRYLDYHQNEIKHYGTFLNDLFNNNIISSYPALIDPDDNSFTAQFEHTIYLDETNKIVFSK